jgi:hypothetical protein
MTRPRAADDFAVIRARMEELRREAVPTPAGSQTRMLPPRPYHTVAASQMRAVLSAPAVTIREPSGLKAA